MDGLKINEVAQLLGVSLVTVYKKVKQLKPELKVHVFKDNKVTFVTPEGVKIIQNSIKVNKFDNDEFNNTNTFNDELKFRDELIKNLNETVKSLKEELNRKSGMLDRVMEQAENQRQRSDTIIMKMSNDLSNAVKAIEGSRAEIRMLEHRMCEAAERNQVPEAEPVQVKGGWMRKFGSWLFELGSPDCSGQAPDVPYRDFRYL